ncbi:colanic acid biosynthesis glycosyl transferase WcaI [Formosa sp. Hel1_31_208]|uniref:WcaI family glycosyltransferase n=1 Tax=Formosa sp. Hel1_31_208 TaxID=1798225 RepID=UPI00087B082E|nr:WcaI family glycosyltransferase [Formosa sp. Hel1_31_208]SDR75445.1 colanic acid biosynthesis glycosyl transferase WcaI [Formosa sp. Hel1_31_208]
MKKKITLIGINYNPEDSAIGLYSTQKAEYLTSKGFEVSVIAGFPYYPQWSIRPDYKEKSRWTKETINNVKVFRYKQYVPSNPSFSKRIRHLLSYTFGSTVNLFKVSKPDYVICIVPFTSTIVLGWLLKLRYGSKLWVHIQDFEFDAAIDSGLLSNDKSVFIKLLLYIEKSLLNKADIVSTISNGMLSKLNNKVKDKQSYYLTNWLDTDAFNITVKTKHRYLTSNKFKILYSGNIGAKQDWEFFFKFLEAIKPLENLEVVVVGEGAEETKVKKELDNYEFTKHYNLVDFEELPNLLNSADLHVLFQKNEVIDTVMPSKILGMMGSGKPSLITGNDKSEVKMIIESSKGGFYFGNDNTDEIVETIIELQKNLEYAHEIGVNAKNYIVKNYSKTNVLDQFIKKINTI